MSKCSNDETIESTDLRSEVPISPPRDRRKYPRVAVECKVRIINADKS
jgi:hypothetical protein